MKGHGLGRDVRVSLLGDGVLAAGPGAHAGPGTAVVVGPGGRVELGDGVQLGEGCRIMAHELVRVGAGARIEDGAALIDFEHVIDDVETPTRLQALRTAPVLIGERAVLGRGSSVLRGVTVGAGARVGPHAVVTRDVPPGAVVAGVPARAVAAAPAP